MPSCALTTAPGLQSDGAVSAFLSLRRGFGKAFLSKGFAEGFLKGFPEGYAEDFVNVYGQPQRQSGPALRGVSKTMHSVRRSTVSCGTALSTHGFATTLKPCGESAVRGL